MVSIEDYSSHRNREAESAALETEDICVLIIHNFTVTVKII